VSNNTCVSGSGYWKKNNIRTLYELDALSGIVESNTQVEEIGKVFE